MMSAEPPIGWARESLDKQPHPLFNLGIITKYYCNDRDVYLVVELAVDGLSITVDQFEGVRAIAIHVSVPIWYASVTEQE